jgi:hypothetical protein
MSVLAGVGAHRRKRAPQNHDQVPAEVAVESLEDHQQLGLILRRVRRAGIGIPQSVDDGQVVASIFGWNSPAASVVAGGQSGGSVERLRLGHGQLQSPLETGLEILLEPSCHGPEHAGCIRSSSRHPQR